MAADTSDLANRLHFLGLDGEASGRLVDMQPVISAHIQEGLRQFYSRVRATDHTNAFFQNDSHVDSARNRQASHWERIATGKFDEAYVEAVTRIGKAHARIGLEPRWYIGGYALVLEQLITFTLIDRWPSMFGKSKAPGLAADISTMVKAALLDMDYAISVYLDELRKEREIAEAARRAHEEEQQEALAKLADILTLLSTGDLESHLSDDLPERYAGMARNYNEAVEALRLSVSVARTTSEQILKAARSISGATADLSMRTVQQAAGVEESSAALHELTESVTATANGAKKAATVVSETLTVAQSSGSVVSEAVKAMSEIEESSDQIANIIGVIDEIAFQTNLLALNAGVEAARAGDAGKGFAVVAQEVRELAQRSASAAREIKDIISRSSGQVRTGVDLVNRSGSALNHIIEKVRDINGIVTGIATAASEQSLGLNEISSAVSNMDSITQHNAGMVEKTSNEINVLTAEVERLTEALRGFKTRDPRVDDTMSNGRRLDDRVVNRLAKAG